MPVFFPLVDMAALLTENVIFFPFPCCPFIIIFFAAQDSKAIALNI